MGLWLLFIGMWIVDLEMDRSLCRNVVDDRGWVDLLWAIIVHEQGNAGARVFGLVQTCEYKFVRLDMETEENQGLSVRIDARRSKTTCNYERLTMTVLYTSTHHPEAAHGSCRFCFIFHAA